MAETDLSLTLTERDAITYALAVGCTEQRYVHERHHKFAPFPTHSAAALYKAARTSPTTHQGDQRAAPALPPFPPPCHDHIPIFDGTTALLDAQLVLECHRHLELGDYAVSSCFLGAEQKRSGALLHSRSELRNTRGHLVHRLISSTFAVGGRSPRHMRRHECTEMVLESVSSRPPDAVGVIALPRDAALLYRLTGDTNPLHCDLEVARASGFERPILHGRCTLGHSVRVVLARFCAGDPHRLRAARARFVATVLPGETLRVMMWAQGERVLFTTTSRAPEADLKEERVVIRYGSVDLGPPSAAL
jgi:acyl dehydratase